MYDIFQVKERVQRGKELLDAEVPGWRDQVAPGELQMEDCQACVLGQVFTDFWTGTDQLDISAKDEYALGFNSWVGEAAYYRMRELGAGKLSVLIDAEFRALENEWLEVIKGG